MPAREPVMSPARKRLLKGAVIVFNAAWIAAVLAFAYGRLRQPSGRDLNAEAWNASYAERGLPVPAAGPRDGFWGARMPRMVPDADTGWREAEAHLEPYADVDRAGMQVVTAPPGRDAHHVLIVGGSVAWGAYASVAEHTWFARLARGLARAGVPARLTVLASGAWDSENELRAVQTRGLSVSPDVIVVLDGINDLMDPAIRHRRKLGKEPVPLDQRVDRYLRNMRALRDIAWKERCPIVFVLQPTPLSKLRRTRLEERVIRLSLGQGLTEDYMQDGYARMRDGLTLLSRAPGTFFVDASGLFDRETATTFADMCHFSDPGHDLLAETLAGPLARIVGGVPPRARTSEAPSQR